MTISTYTYTAYLVGTPDEPIDLKSGTISLDAGSSPHVNADLVIGPVSEAVYELLDPRLSPRVRVEVSALSPSGVTTRTFDLGVRSRPITYLDGDYGLALASDEAILSDVSPLTDDSACAAMTSGRDVVEYVLDTVIPGTTLAGSNDFTILGDADAEALIWRTGVTALEFLHPILQASGFRLVCDEEREWTIRDEGYAVPGTIVIRYLQNLIDANETIDKDAGFWFDAAVTRYKWTDTLGVQHEATDTYALIGTPTRVQTFDRTTAFPGTGFSEYAVRRAQGRGREVDAVCISDWRAKAEQWTEVLLPGTPIQTGICSSVTFNLGTDEMTVTTRSVDTPDSAWVILPEGEAWLDSPIGDDWISEVV